MGDIEFLLTLLVAIALLAQLARMLHVPYPIFLVLGGLAIGFVPGLPHIELEPEIVFLVFLPPLLQSAAFFSSPHDLRAHMRPIGMLALGLVFATMGAVAVAAHEVVGLPWAAAFVLGAVVAPTDPIAAEAVFSRLGAPDRVATVVGGESLVNDGSALVAYKIAVAAVATGTFSLVDAGLDFLLETAGGTALGLLLGRMIVPTASRAGDRALTVTIGLLAPYVAYISGEELGVSGVLAVVALGLYLGWQNPTALSASTRQLSYAFWEVLVFLLNSLLFVLIGLQFPQILDGLERFTAGELLGYAALISGVVIGLRLLWVALVPLGHGPLNRILLGDYTRAPWRERALVGWSGMRGAVSLAAALALPLEAGGAPFPGRDLILFLAFAVIFSTLILQGLTLPGMMRALSLASDPEPTRRAEFEARLEAARVALKTLDRICSEERVPPQARERMRELYENRIERWSARLDDADGDGRHDERSAAYREWRRELLDAERRTVIDLRDRGAITPEILRRIERDLDLEEARVGG